MRIRHILATAAILGTAAGVPAVLAATSASAATTAPAATVAFHSHQWSLNGPNKLTLVYNGHSYSYNVRLATIPFSRHLELVTGSLRDSYEPVAISIPVSGVIFGNDVVLSAQYPVTGTDAGPQGVRTFSGSIDRHGNVTGSWSETGSEAGTGSFTLAFPAVR